MPLLRECATSWDEAERSSTSWAVPLSKSALADVKLCAGEIITNALLHAGGECWVRTCWTGRHLRVEVADRSLRLPSVPASGEEAVSGRGLALVDAFAYSWGWEPHELGKLVHFMIAADTMITGHMRLTRLVQTAHVRTQNALMSPEPAPIRRERVVA